MVPFPRLRVLLFALLVVAAIAAGVGAVDIHRHAEPSLQPRVEHHDRAQAVERPKRRHSVSLAWVGDISLSSSYGLPDQPGRTLFADVRSRLSATDITIANLEGTLGSGGGSKCGAGHSNCFAFQAPPAYARVFRRAGIDVMNVANNHAYDFGAQGQRQTLAALKHAGIAHSGRPRQVLIRRVRGVRLAILGFAPYRWAADLRDIKGGKRLVRRARRKADVVVVVIHAGAEGSDKTHTPAGTEIAFGENRGQTRRFAHAAVGAGADLVLGSGPHVVRGLERYRGRLIAYSLGNFLGYHTFSTGGTLSASGILRVRVAPSGRPLGGRWTSVQLDGAGLPHLDPARQSAQLVRELSHQDFGPRAYPLTAAGRLGSTRGGER
jgi:hypothetical protein